MVVWLVCPAAPGIPRSLRFAGSRPLTLCEGGVSFSVVAVIGVGVDVVAFRGGFAPRAGELFWFAPKDLGLCRDDGGV